MTSFEKFKEALKTTKKEGKEIVAIIAERIKVQEDFLKDPDGYEVIPKKVNLKDSILQCFPSLYKKKNIKEAEKSLLLDKAAYIENNDLYQFVSYTVNAYGKDCAINVVKDPFRLILFCLKHLCQGKINISDATKVLGSSWRFNKEHEKSVPSSMPFAEKELISALGDFFDIHGEFLNAGDSEKLKSLYNSFLKVDKDLEKLGKGKKEGFETFESLVDGITLEYQAYLEKLAKEASLKPKVVVEKVKEEDLNLLAEYYQNGTLIKMPEDLEAFYNLLKACQIKGSEVRHIDNLIEKYRTTDFHVSEPEDEKISLEFDDVTNNLVFLKNSKGEVYFLEDLEKFNKTTKAKVYKLLSKINKSREAKFRPILSNKKEMGRVFEVVLDNIHILFTEIGNGIYLVIGADNYSVGYDTIPLRLYIEENKEYIKYLKAALTDPEEAKKILLENDPINFEGLSLERKKDN